MFKRPGYGTGFIKSIYQKNSETGDTEMSDNTKEIEYQEMDTVGMAFMGFLMGAGVILGIWFLSGLIQVISKMMA